MSPVPAAAGTAEWYREFGTVDAPGNSACYAEWSLGINARLRGRFLLLEDGLPTAIAGPHGQSLEWIEAAAG